MDPRLITYNTVDVAVIGAGPAGLMAGVAAAEEGAQVVVFEQGRQAAAKLAATGGGGCTLAPTCDSATLMARFGREGRFMEPALDVLDTAGLCAFMAELGVATYTPDGRGIEAKSESAEQVRAAMLRRVEELLGVTLRLGTRVTGLRLEDGRLGGLTTDGGSFRVPRVVLATGGRACPQLGATGSGYALAAQAGHTIVEPRPALVPLLVKETWVHACAGVSLSPARVWIDLPGEPNAGETGDLFFTHMGLSGPAVLDLSGAVGARLARDPAVPLRLAVTPDENADAHLARFEAWETEAPRKTVRNLLDGRLPDSLASALVEAAGLAPDATISQTSHERRRALAGMLAGARLTVTGTEGFAKAWVTRGGVRLKDVDPETLQSRLVEGLYFAGEVLDLDGPCGGYNLQWAFSSGRLAGLAAGQV